MVLKTWPSLSSKCCGGNNFHVCGAGSPNSTVLSYLETLEGRLAQGVPFKLEMPTPGPEGQLTVQVQTQRGPRHWEEKARAVSCSS